MSEDVQDQTSQDLSSEESSSDASEQKTDTDTGTDAGQKPDTDTSEGAEGKPEGVGTKADQEFMENLLLDYGLDSPEQLKDLINEMEDMKDRLGGEDIDDLLDNKALMQKYQQHWAAEEARKKKEAETPEETIVRLEKEITERDKRDQSDKAKQERAREANRLLTDFNNTVNKTINSMKEVPKEYRGFLAAFMGVDNPVNDVDLNDKGKIVDLTKKGGKKLMEFEQAVIKRYLAGKAEVPKVKPSTETTPETEKKPVKNMNEARARLTELAKNILAKKKDK